MDKEKSCPICEAIIVGRSDKKFCSMKCKSIDQYEKRQKNEGFFLKVEKQLRINRKLLKRFNRSGFATIRKSELISVGFNPKFFTHYWKNAKGEVYLFVYEYGFLSKTTHGKEKYILVTWQEYMN
jgi:predicted nucleic acid-binding Zn ribbon protein